LLNNLTRTDNPNLLSHSLIVNKRQPDGEFFRIDWNTLNENREQSLSFPSFGIYRLNPCHPNPLP
jgi:hypothetical protein